MMASHLQIAVVETLDDLKALSPEWQVLWEKDPHASPFQSPAWLLSWARHFTSGRIHGIALRDEPGELVGFLPGHVSTHPPTGARQLTLLGQGNSDYCGGVFREDVATECMGAVMEHLAECPGWDELSWRNLSWSSPMQRATGAMMPDSMCPVLDLPDSPAQRPFAIPKAQWDNLRYYRRHADRLGPWRCTMADESSFESVFDDFIALHTARRGQQGEEGAFRDGSMGLFLREASRAFLRRGVLRLYRLSVGERTVAVLCGFSSKRRAFHYLGGFAPEFSSISPGTLVLGHAIEEAVREGCRSFDFLRGQERYKYLWGAKDTQTFQWRATRAELRAAVSIAAPGVG